VRFGKLILASPPKFVRHLCWDVILPSRIVLVAVVYHTRSLRGSRYEVPLNVAGLDEGGFDAQSIYTIPAVKLIRRRAVLNSAQLKLIEEKVKLWLGLS
jgi:mRNA-degrading endonuclease toxin of MazEF toxin-antitoxin module